MDPKTCFFQVKSPAVNLNQTSGWWEIMMMRPQRQAETLGQRGSTLPRQIAEREPANRKLIGRKAAQGAQFPKAPFQRTSKKPTRKPPKRNKGKIGARSPEEFAYVFNNISVWGPTAEEFLHNGALDRAQLWGVAEHHLRGENVSQITTAARLGGRNVFASAARKTKWSEKSGGTALMPKKHLALGNCGGLEAIENKNAHIGTDLLAIRVRLRKNVVVFGAADLTHSQGAGGDNTAKLREIGNFLVNDGWPFAFLGDWNMTPQQLQASAGGWLKLTRKMRSRHVS